MGGLPDAPPGFVWPLRGRVIAGFGSPVGGAPNQGIDLAVPAGTDIHAAEDGVVIYAGDEIRSFGNLLLLRHRDGFLTAYAHAQSFAVKPGDTVRRGQVIATSGQSGGVTRPQLHFEIRKDHAPVDPAQYLPPPGDSNRSHCEPRVSPSASPRINSAKQSRFTCACILRRRLPRRASRASQ